MSKARLVITAVVLEGRSVAQVCAHYGVSRSWLYELVARYREEGDAAFEPRSRRPHTCPKATPPDTIELIVRLRKELTEAGLDAGPATLVWHLQHHHQIRVSAATLARILTREGLITPAPKKRPKASYIRFQADMPNQTWQSDFTHYRLSEGTDTEILNWLDDHSRYLLACTAHRRVSGPDVVASFTATSLEFGLPAATLTDNGSVYTSRFTGGHNDFERLLAALGITQKNGHPGHPQTQGKIERFHQTLKRWLAARPRPATLAELQSLLDAFRTVYNTERGHRAHPHHLTPERAYLARPKATPANQPSTAIRLRTDVVDHFGKLTLRHGSRLHHLGIGRAHASTPVLILVTATTVTVISKTGHHVIASHHIDPDHNYWPNKQKNPGTSRGNL